MLETNKHDKDREIQQISEWASRAGYGLGFLAGSAAFGLVFGVILGSFSILNHSRNEWLKNQTELVSKRSHQNQISLEDLENLSIGKPISNQEYIRTAIFIDELERQFGSLQAGQKVGDNYTFTKTIDPNGVINYNVEDSQTNRVALSFDLDRDGKIAVQSRHNVEAMKKLNEFVILTADKVSINVNENISLYSEETNQAKMLEQKLKSLKTSIETLNRVDLSRLATTSESARSQYIESQDELNQELSELKTQAKAIADRIHTAEVANDKESQRHPENTLLGIKVSRLVDRLVGLDKQIDRLQSDLQGKPQTVDEIKAYRQEVNVESTAPRGEIDALKREIRELREHVKVLTSAQPVTRSVTPPPPRSSNLPQNLSQLQFAEPPDLDEVTESPANGQPIAVVQSESPDYAESQGIEQ